MNILVKHATHNTHQLAAGVWTRVATKNIARAALYLIPSTGTLGTQFYFSNDPGGANSFGFAMPPVAGALLYSILPIPSGVEDVYLMSVGNDQLVVVEETFVKALI
jgi:hypothetical protein